jgi:threonyl-tRNA synthetase
VLGQVLELEYGVDLTIGPALEEGFYYDCFMGDKVQAAPGTAQTSLAQQTQLSCCSNCS